MKEFMDKVISKPIAAGIVIGAVTSSIVKIVKVINEFKQSA